MTEKITRDEAQRLIDDALTALDRIDDIVVEIITREAWTAFDVPASSFFGKYLPSYRPRREGIRIMLAMVLAGDPESQQRYASSTVREIAAEVMERGVKHTDGSAAVASEAYRVKRDLKARAAKAPKWTPIAERIEKGSCRKYGSKEYLRKLLDRQGGAMCAICLRSEAEVGGLCVDHDHDSNRARGFLCGRCNTAIGMFDEDRDRLSLAISYVSRAEAIREMA